MILTPAQNEIAADLHRFRTVNCGRRFGKTTLSIEEIKGKTLAKPSRVAYIAPTYQQARDIAWEHLKREMVTVANSINESRLEIRNKTVKGGESLIILRGWESIETMRGQQFDFVVIDEVASMRNFWVNWEEVLRPTLTDTRGEGLFISTPKGFNHFYNLYNLQETDPDFKSFHFTTYDNPYIPVDEIEKAKLQMTPDRFAQEYLADFRKTEGLVYKGFDRDKHVYKDKSCVVVDRLAGIDWGWTNPAASHLIEKDSDRHYWISQEFYKTNKTTAEIVEHVKSLRATKVYPDPAEPDRNEEARRAGLNIREVSKDVEAGISCVQELLKQDRLHIHVSCVNLINELETYAYPDKKPDHNEAEAPIKENDHALDEIRYVLYMQEGKANLGTAQTHYSSSTMPRNNLTPFQQPQGAPPELKDDFKPRTATTYIPRL